jgi:hypothetical protein
MKTPQPKLPTMDPRIPQSAKAGRNTKRIEELRLRPLRQIIAEAKLSADSKAPKPVPQIRTSQPCNARRLRKPQAETTRRAKPSGSPVTQNTMPTTNEG